MFPPSLISFLQSCDVCSISGADKALGISYDQSAADGRRKLRASSFKNPIYDQSIND